jgi:8-oxo-dGTP pyrophosphatase MutT (NUDIX family)
VPGGRVDAPESFSDGARRECIEEAGIHVELKGILRIEQSCGGYNMNRLKSKDHLNQLFIIVNQPIHTKFPSKLRIKNP